MNKTLLYKKINLLIRILVGVAAVFFIVIKLIDDFSGNFSLQLINIFNYKYVFFAFFLVFINWSIEAYKWKFLIRKTKEVSFFSALKITITGITLGIITPNRIGEIPGRALLIDEKNKLKQLILETSVGAYSQFLATFIFGAIAVLYTLDLFKLKINLLYLKLFIVLIAIVLSYGYFFHQSLKSFFYKVFYFKKKKIFEALNVYDFKQLFYILFLSITRYFCFSFQYFLLFRAFDVNFSTWKELLLIPLCFMVTSAIPTILISEIGIRGSVAIVIFGGLNQGNFPIIFATLLLWLINVAFPALIGVSFLKKLTIFSEK